MTSQGIGAPVRRKEDRRFLTGRGNYVGDYHVPGALHLAFVRSIHAHATIGAIDTSAARSMPGVVDVLTAEDLEADGIKPIPNRVAFDGSDGRPLPVLPRPALVRDIVRVVGDAVAVVVGETSDAAHDAAEAVHVDYDDKPAVVTMDQARADGTELIWDDAPGNRAYVWESGDAAAAEEAFANAAHVVSLDLVNNRITANPMEPRLVVAEPDVTTGGLIFTLGSQAPHLLRTRLAGLIDIPESQLRIVSPDFGGGFGMRGSTPYPEDIVACWLARRLDRPVRWTGTRHEVLMTDTQARDQETRAELALDGDGRFLALRIHTKANLGAYLIGIGALLPIQLYAPLIAGIYRIGAVDLSIEGIITNTVPTAPYRGAGRPEAAYVIERLADEAAIATGIDRIEIRRRNMYRPDDLPATNVMGLTIDSGDFSAVLDRAMNDAAVSDFASRRAQSEAGGRYRGLGFATYIESAADGSSTSYESARLRVNPTGTATLHVGTHSHGQGHATAFVQIAADRLGLPIDAIDLSYGDTEREPYGLGTYGSRSLVSAGPAIAAATDKVIAKGRHIAAHLFETEVDDVTYADGMFAVAGTNRQASFAEIAHAAYVPHNFPHDRLEPGLDETAFNKVQATTFPNGCHVAEVEIDPNTGVVTLLNYVCVDDIGTVVNPMIAEAQIHGAVAQGVGQALMELCHYHPDTGQFQSATFLDYCMPRAGDLPMIDWSTRPVPTGTNSLGVKGVGEIGTIAAPPAVMNAILDALRPIGVTHLDMPATAETVWRAIQNVNR